MLPLVTRIQPVSSFMKLKNRISIFNIEISLQVKSFFQGVLGRQAFKPVERVLIILHGYARGSREPKHVLP